MIIQCSSDIFDKKRYIKAKYSILVDFNENWHLNGWIQEIINIHDVELYDIQHSKKGVTEKDILRVKRNIKKYSKLNLANFTIETDSFSPIGSSFFFNLGRDDCHYMKKGICKLDLNFSKEGPRCLPENDKDYCNFILRDMREKQKWNINKVDLVHYQCGHFIVADGQHRLCIASRAGLTLEAEITYENERCLACRGHKSFEYLKTF